ncbi:MAG: hypothetical protein CMJ78_00450 [Planctomycetaceae bacterium]|nr:hypothetical protein [Planctomycetaceae bacterium]
MRNIDHNQRPQHRRAGLAPLELVLSLPIMLFVMGLIIIVGTTGAWKVRNVSTSRQAAWRTTWPKNGHFDENPRSWPDYASMERLDPEDAFIPHDPMHEHFVVRGPVVADPESGKTMVVREELFDMQRGMVSGMSQIQKDFPVLGKMPPGQIDLERQHRILDDRWQFQQMAIPSNRERRVLFMYPVDLAGMIPGHIDRYVSAATDILNSDDSEELSMLDNDDELRQRRPGLPYNPPFGIGYAPDYHLPENRQLRRQLLNPQRVCSFDAETLRENIGDPMVYEIAGFPRPRGSLSLAGVPGKITRDYLRMYRSHLAYIEYLRDLAENPSTPPEIVAHIQQRMPIMNSNEAQMEGWVQELEDFAQTLVP